jgi:hypothetical protein
MLEFGMDGNSLELYFENFLLSSYDTHSLYEAPGKEV